MSLTTPALGPTASTFPPTLRLNLRVPTIVSSVTLHSRTRRFDLHVYAEPDSVFVGGPDDDPVDAVTDILGAPRMMVDLRWFPDLLTWDR